MGDKLTDMKCLMKMARNEFVMGEEERFKRALPLKEDLMRGALRAQTGAMIPVVAGYVRAHFNGGTYVPRITMANHFFAGLGAATGGWQ